jgi:hypothetical protein
MTDAVEGLRVLIAPGTDVAITPSVYPPSFDKQSNRKEERWSSST